MAEREQNLEADLFRTAVEDVCAIGARVIASISRPTVALVIAQTPDPIAANVAAEAGIAFAAFAGTVWTMSRVLRQAGQLEIPLIGTFRTEVDDVTFIPAEDLLELLAANHPITA